MAYELYQGDPTNEQARVEYYMRLLGMVRLRRLNHEIQWEESAALTIPEYRNSFTYGHVRTPGMKYSEFQVDSTGTIAAYRFMAIADALLTPHNLLWSVIRANDKNLMKDLSVRRYFGQVTDILWESRYRPGANFAGNNQKNMLCLGVFGNQGMYIDEMDTRLGLSPGPRYLSTSPGEIYLLVGHQGLVDGFIRHFRWTARQAYGRWRDKIPKVLQTALEQNSQTQFDFLQIVLPNTDYSPYKLFTKEGKKWTSCYVSVQGYSILEEGGYRTFPLAHGRYQIAPEEDYGRGPGQMVLPELKTLNAEKGVFLKQGHRAGDPSYLIGDDGLLDFKDHPGSYNYGGFNDEGRKIVDIVPTGNIQVTKEMMDESAKIINDAFLVSLFPLLFDDKGGQKSAREVIEAANDRGIFLAPTLVSQYEYIGTLINRELDILSYLGMLPPMPPALQEARGEYKLVYTSPLARSLRGQEVAGFWRTVQMTSEAVHMGADPSLLDIFDFDTALPEIADIEFSPIRWMADPQQVAQKRQARAKAQQQENYIKSLPGLAARDKAAAIMAKAQTGGNIGGTLSGTPEGGMPMVPGNPAGMPGMPGPPGQPGTPGRPA